MSIPSPSTYLMTLIVPDTYSAIPCMPGQPCDHDMTRLVNLETMWQNAMQMASTGPDAHDHRRGRNGGVPNTNSDEDRWRRAQVSTLSPLHPPSQIADPLPACHGPPPHVRTHRSAMLSAWNLTTARPPQMWPDQQRRQVNNNRGRLTTATVG